MEPVFFDKIVAHHRANNFARILAAALTPVTSPSLAILITVLFARSPALSA